MEACAAPHATQWVEAGNGGMIRKTPAVAGAPGGAGDGNRTRATSLGSWSSTIELRPRRHTPWWRDPMMVPIQARGVQCASTIEDVRPHPTVG